MPYNTTTSHSDFIPQSWAAEVQLAYDNFKSRGALDVASNVSDAMDGNTLNVARQPAGALETRAEGTALTRAQVSASTRQLVISTEKGKVYPVTTKLGALSKYDPRLPLVLDAVQAAANEIDSALLALHSSAGISVAGVTGSNITEAQFREAAYKFDLANAPREGRYAILSPLQYNTVMGWDVQRRFDAVGTTNGPIVTGQAIEMFMGFRIQMSHNVRVTIDGFTHNVFGVQSTTNPLNSSLQYAFRPFPANTGSVNALTMDHLGLRIVTDYDIDYASQVIGIEQIFGVASLRAEWLADVETAD